MLKKTALRLIIFAIALIPGMAMAASDLMDIFHDALGNDPTFKAAQDQYLANQENLPIARSYLLPNINIQGTTLRQHVEQTPVIVAGSQTITLQPQTFYNTSNIYSLNLSQPIFNYSAWYQVKNASYQVRQAEATFVASAQDLMIRTAQAYFAVMQASDTLRYTLAQKKAVAEQLNQAKQQYDVGLIAITAVSEAQAKYDSVLANEIAARNNLAVAMEQLRAITGRTYSELAGVSSDLPLVRPDPADIEQWVNIAECQNYTLHAAIENANAAQQNIEVQRGGHFPVINAVGSFTDDKESNPGQFGFSELKTTEGGVSINFPIYQGGLVNAQTKQADYLYQQAISNMELTHRTVVTQARDSYLGVITGINKIRADREAIISAQIALKATEEGYKAGTRTILDVLNNQSSLYQAQINYSADQYNYLTSILTLKQAAGTLSPSDLQKVNTWLRQNVDIANSIARIGTYSIQASPNITSTDDNLYKVKKQKSSSKSKIPLNKSEQKKVAEIKKQTEYLGKSTASKMTNTKDYYVIELFDTRYEQHAKKFIADHHIENKATVIATQNAKGEARYQVVYGNYPNLQAAESAIKQLPADLQKLNPWIKRMNAK